MSRFFAEVHPRTSGDSSVSLPIASVDLPRLERVRGRRARAARRAALVIASPMAESRKRWIQRLQGMAAICEVTERRGLEQVMAHLKPDILVVDLALPGLRRARGLCDIQRLSASTKIVALTDALAEGEGIIALKAGVKGYCTRTIDAEQLKKAVAAVQRGEIWAPRRLVPRLVAELLSLAGTREKEAVQDRVDPRLASLTARQRAIADLISKGACNKEIAKWLDISERTVKAHLTEVFRNVGVSDRLQLALLLKADRSATG